MTPAGIWNFPGGGLACRWVAPLFDLSGLRDPEQRAALFGRLMPLIHALTPEVVTRDTGAYLDFLADRDDVAPGPVGITGYCMGGTNALRAVEAYPDRIAALASFHAGRVVTDAPDSPHLGVGSVTGELYFAHADRDQSMTAEQIATLEKALVPGPARPPYVHSCGRSCTGRAGPPGRRAPGGTDGRSTAPTVAATGGSGTVQDRESGPPRDSPRLATVGR